MKWNQNTRHGNVQASDGDPMPPDQATSSCEFDRRSILALGAGALLTGLTPAANAQDKWPSHTITIVVPFTPGTSMDVLARKIGPVLSNSLGQPVIIDNRAGASGNIGSKHVATAPADGYTLMMTVSTLVMNPHVQKNVPYDVIRSFAPIGRVAVGSLVLAVHPSFPAKTLEEGIKQLGAKPDAFTYASPGNGTPQHLAMELFKQNAKVNIRHIPYKGSAGAVTDLLSGHVNAMILPANMALPHKNSGKLRVLATLTGKRLPVMPDVPTFSEQGVQNNDVDLWFALMAPANTPPAIVSRLHTEVGKALTIPEINSSLDKIGLTVSLSTPNELAKLIADENTRWSNVVKTAGITAD